MRQQHLNIAPAPLTAAPVALAALVEECLYKAAEARPAPADILARLARATAAAPSGGLASLHQANRANVARRGETGRLASAQQSEAEHRQTLADTAVQALTRIAATLRDAIMEAAPSASLSTGPKGRLDYPARPAELPLAPPVPPLRARYSLRQEPPGHLDRLHNAMEAFETAAPGDVLVVDNGGRLDEACAGDLVAL